MTRNGKTTNHEGAPASPRKQADTLYVGTRAQAAIYEFEMKGQLSDGRWENSLPFNHWVIPANAQVVVRPEQVGRNFDVRRGYNFGERELFDAVGARMTRYVKVALAFPDVSIEALGAFRWHFNEDIGRELRGYNPKYVEQFKLEIKTLLALVHVTNPDEFEARVDAITFTEKDCRREASKLTTCFRTRCEDALAPGKLGVTKVVGAPMPPPKDFRYIHVAALTNDGSTISTQCWTHDIAKAEAALARWLRDDKIALAVISDPRGDTTYYRADGVALTRLDSLNGGAQ